MYNNPYDEWEYVFTDNPHTMWNRFEKDKPKSVSSDTESTGLHIIKDKPFLIQLGWGRIVYLFHPTPDMMKMYFKIASQVKWHILQNVKYDMHMLANIGYRKEVESLNNWCDLQAIMRLVLEAKSPRDGGDKLGLKGLAVKYIHPYGDNSEKMVNAALKKLNDDRVKVLTAALKQFDKVGSYTPTGKQQKWGKKHIEDFLKDVTSDIADLPEDIRDIWEVWNEEYPEPTYADIDPAIMNQYAGEDVASTLMLAERAFPTLLEREQLDVLKRECACIIPTFRMERVGLKADMNYLESSRIRMKAYIIKLREELYTLAGELVTPGQHERLRELFNTRWDIMMESCDKSSLKKVIKNFDGEPKRFAELITTLRTAEKWYSTYIVRVQKLASYDGRAYTQINLNGAISGRMSSDFQQFPKDSFKDKDGNILFNPRRAFVVGGQGYKGIFIDYDQIELVGQSHYCVVMKAEGVNLPRAYMPYKCTHYQTGEIYMKRHNNEDMRHLDKQPNGESVWLDEQGKPWVKTDTHSLTTSLAFPHIDPKSEEFKKVYRPKGKMTNFSSNYGVGVRTLQEQLDSTYEEAETLLNGYKEAYPEVITYQKGIITAHKLKGYVTNHYGRRYYLKDYRGAYKLGNYVVQGSCADALKEAIINLDTFLLPFKSHMVMPIHDEIAFTVYDDEQHIIPSLLKIMENAFDWCIVPVTAGVEVSKTYWSDKKEEVK